MRAIDLIPVPSALGAPDPGVAQGPDALRRAGLAETLQHMELKAAWQPTVNPLPAGSDAATRWQALATLCTELSQRVAACRLQGQVPLVLGGDHAMAVGTWRGIAAHEKGPIGLLWIDAHLDAHTPEDSASGNPHGMPVALLLGDGDPPLAHPSLRPQYLCLVGARSWELPERIRLERYGVRVFDQQEIDRRGLAVVMAEAVTIVSGAAAGFGISLDLDVFASADAPGVNSPVAGGLPAEEWLAALRGLARRTDCLALEIAECDGSRDIDGRTAALACRAAAALLDVTPT
ncbi:MAG: arginase [Rhodocyclaceae bacterium]|nr:MAG: arginase [Rhodocyclaceae bacterium]